MELTQPGYLQSHTISTYRIASAGNTVGISNFEEWRHYHANGNAKNRIRSSQPGHTFPSQSVGKLLLSLDEPTVSEVERLWLDEAEKRLDDYRAGKIQGIPGNDVFKRAIAELS